ncbi:heme lyase CcmF/NrfE family subunit [Halodesulfovibrio marinisediminis]|uniref:Cytochrome c-type biogenesis protein CcmF n=1 Tax=Halodesulfovibrio marinisediminis DSM 17456 TaxID=1121457 RepID=A0A1N6ICF0_9BACT|nr:cytochrome c-type biogenesis CcmF C-terminal domain-containing protein [Halodesulfovibrio marinisediminis]SIO29625.1 cytochrome c-type biogenesis protein CcmF [Halodesulfovibrio marinisediminis DSM 17456]
MHLLAFLLLVASLLFAIGFGAVAALQIWQGRSTLLHWIEKSQMMITTLITVSSFILLWALVNFDFSNYYVSSYTSLDLPLFYRITAFWAGQAGSLLFWAWSVALCGIIFLYTNAYRALSDGTKMWFWMLFLTFIGFFLFLLTTWSNPFTLISPVPADGNGLNPLLQNPGMIFHPPLLFLGYGGFTIPSCLALAQALNRSQHEEASWTDASRNMILFAWLTLTAGIILGCWWSYMELGWGGYWAWDPVENASLIPWLVGSAFLHTSVIESRRGKLHRTNTFLVALTTISAVFATYLVRSGVVESLHAFGDGGVGTPLLIFIIFFTALSLFASVTSKNPKAKPMAELFSREGLLLVTAWFLIALGVIILIATMWPVFSKFFTSNPQGLEQDFYNKVCMPLAAIISVLLMICPWMKWKGGVKSSMMLSTITGVFIATGVGMYIAGYQIPVSILAVGSAAGCIAGIIMLFATDASVRKSNRAIGAYGVHVGVALIVIGIAFSGPYKQEIQTQLSRGGTATLEEYTFKYKELYEGEAVEYIFLQAEIDVFEGDKYLGTLEPQRRIYKKFGNNRTFAEVSIIPSLGEELYSSLLGADAKGNISVTLSIEPMVNWFWIGGTLMCLFPFIGFTRFRKSEKVTDAA